MAIRFLDVAAVETLHHQRILQFGGSPGIRDRGLLESAVLRAENKEAYEPGSTLGSIAATLGYGLIKNHAFIDGNKRIGLGAMAVFLDQNGFQITASQDDQIAMVLRVASSEMTEADWTAWVEANIAPLS